MGQAVGKNQPSRMGTVLAHKRGIQLRSMEGALESPGHTLE